MALKNCDPDRRRSPGWLGVVAACCCWPMPGHAQQPDTPVGTTATFHAGTQLVLLDASVANRKTGKVVPGLTAEDFILSEDGAPQRITSVSQGTLPLSLLFLFDATDTVRPVLWPLALGARRLLEHLREGDQIAVATFSTHVSVLQNFTADAAKIKFALGDASGTADSDQATFIYEDLFEATETMRQTPRRDSRRVEVWLTDGTSNYEDDAMRKLHGRGAPAVLHTRDQAAGSLGRSDVVVSALIKRSVLTEAQRRQPEHSRFGDIEHFAEVTGGPVQYTTQAEVVDRFAGLIDALRERYTLGYKPAQAKPPGTVCKLQLVLSSSFFAHHPELRAKDIALRSRQSYTR